MKAKLKLFTMSFLFMSVWKLQKLIRFCLNGRCYPRGKKFRDIYIGKYAYKYFGKFNCGHLFVEFNSPYSTKDMLLVSAHYGTRCETRRYLTRKELLSYL